MINDGHLKSFVQAGLFVKNSSRRGRHSLSPLLPPADPNPKNDTVLNYRNYRVDDSRTCVNPFKLVLQDWDTKVFEGSEDRVTQGLNHTQSKTSSQAAQSEIKTQLVGE